jgi:hypothetical protein
MVYAQSLMVVLLMTQTWIAAALAGDRAILPDAAAVNGQKRSGQHTTKDAGLMPVTPLDRIAAAVDGAESSHGKNPAMWRPDPSGPQGPMQVGAAATTDVGGGDRFDLSQNRAIGRAYLARLYGRYKNWPDAVAAYNWGLSNVDTWIRAGRPPQKLLAGVAAYTTRVLYDSGLCSAGQTTQLPEFAILHSDPGPSPAGANPLSHSILAHFDADAGAFTRNQQYLCGSVPSSFSRAGRLRARERTTPQSRLAEMTASAQRAWRLATRGSQM